MWKSLGIILNSPIKFERAILSAENLTHQQLRTTYILKRKKPPLLHKKGDPPKTLRSRHYIYDLIGQTHLERQPDIDVILTAYVEGIGNIGDRVSVRSHFAYNNLLLPGLAVYASPTNIEKFKTYAVKKEELHSSPNASLTVKIMSRMMLSVVMNKDMPWILKPWHVKVSFRKCGYIVPEETITIPEKPIKGPDMNLQDKEFFVTVTINNLEKVNVRCRIHHWSTDTANRLPYVPNFWEQPSEAIFFEQAAILETIPKKPTKQAVNT